MKRYALRRNRKVFARVYCKIKNHIKNLEVLLYLSFLCFLYIPINWILSLTKLQKETDN